MYLPGVLISVPEIITGYLELYTVYIVYDSIQFSIQYMSSI